MEHLKNVYLSNTIFKINVTFGSQAVLPPGVQAASEMKPISVSDSQEVSYSGHWLLEALTAMVEVH